MTTLSTDTFVRANQSGFGTSSGGDVWGAPLGTATANITSNEGVLSGGNGGDVEVILGSQTASNINMLLRTASSDTSNLNGLLWRFSNTSGGNGYRCGFDTFFGGSGGFGIDKYVNGSRSNVGSFTTGTVINPNEFWWIRLIHDASNLLQIRVWKDGTSEPGTWNFSQTDASFTTGNFGVSAFLRTSTTISYDHLTVTDNQSSGTQSIRDIATRFRLKSADQLKDIKTRFRLMSANQLKDVMTRFRLMSANQLKDLSTRFRLMSANITKDISTRFILALASQRLKDISTRFRLISANQLKDIASRFILAAANTRTKDIICRFILAGGNITTTTAYGRDGKVVASARNGLVTAKGR